MILQVNTVTISAMEDISNPLSVYGQSGVAYGQSSTARIDGTLPSGNRYTEYTNTDENNERRTIHWVNGIEPPKMGGADSQFKRIVSADNNFIEYVAPYEENMGWYDSNKHKKGDQNLCFVAAAANSLQWWIDRNRSYIEDYLNINTQYPENKMKELQNILNKKDVSQENGLIYEKYFKIFQNKPDGYWPDVLIGHFVNGYTPIGNGGAIEHDYHGKDLLKNGPEKHGGFFYDVFKEKTLAYRYTISTYPELKSILKDIDNGDIFMLIIQIMDYTHVVTLWGVEYDEKGDPVAVYYTDSDDVNSIENGMRRYKLFAINNVPYVTTHINNRNKSKILNLVRFSPSKPIIPGVSVSDTLWQEAINPTVKEINLEWKELAYNGKEQTPIVTSKDIVYGDDVKLIVSGKGKNAGSYPVNITMKGTTAYKYKLPDNIPTTFTINKANPTVKLNVNTNYDKSITFNATVMGVDNENLNGTVIFKDGNKKIAEITLTNNQAEYIWRNPQVADNHLVAEFTPTNNTDINYNRASSNVIVLDSYKVDQAPLVFEFISEKKYGDMPFEIKANGGSVAGNIIYTSDRPNILSINNNIATIHKVGTVTITATLKGNDKYKDATATYQLEIKKAIAPNIDYPTATTLNYGQKLYESVLNGGSLQYGYFVWENGDIVPNVKNSGYPVRFVPSYETTENYEPITNLTGIVKIDVNRVDTNVNLIAEPIHKDNNININLSLYVEKEGFGEVATGKVKFIDCTNGQSTEITEVSLTDGVAKHTWENVQQQIYSVKAIYSGDENYSAKTTLPIDIDIRKKPQEHFELENVGNKTYGDKEFKLFTKGGTGNGKISFSSNNPNVISIVGDIATVHNVGDVVITAVKKGNDEYNDAVATINVTVNKKLLVIKANDQKIVQGSTIPKFTYRVDGLVNGDKLTKEPTITTNLKDTNTVGKYIISITNANFTNIENYNVIYKDGILLIVNGSNPDGGSGGDGTPDSSSSENSSNPNYDTDDDYISSGSSVNGNSGDTNKFVENKKSDQSSTSTSTGEKESLLEENINSNSDSFGSGSDEISESSVNSNPSDSKQANTDTDESAKKSEGKKSPVKAIAATIVALGAVSLGIFYLIKFKKF